MARGAGRVVPLLVLVGLLAAGCGGVSRKGRTVTFADAGAFPPSTIVGTYTVQGCRRDALQMVRQARLFYIHSTSAPGPADLYYHDLRLAYAHFEADDCASSTLGDAMNQHLTPRARTFVLHNVASNLRRVFQTALSAATGRTSS